MIREIGEIREIREIGEKEEDDDDGVRSGLFLPSKESLRESRWYVQDDDAEGRSVGPYPFKDLVAWASSGLLDGGTYVLSEDVAGNQGWKMLEDVVTEMAGLMMQEEEETVVEDSASGIGDGPPAARLDVWRDSWRGHGLDLRIHGRQVRHTWPVSLP